MVQRSHSSFIRQRTRMLYRLRPVAVIALMLVGCLVAWHPAHAQSFTDPFTGGSINVPPPPDASPPTPVDSDDSSDWDDSSSPSPSQPVVLPRPPQQAPAPVVNTPTPAPTPAPPAPEPPPVYTPPPAPTPPPVDPAVEQMHQQQAFEQAKQAMLAQFNVPALDAVPMPAQVDTQTAFGNTSRPPAALQIGETEWREIAGWLHDIRALEQKASLTGEEQSRLNELYELRNAYWVSIVNAPGLTDQDRRTMRLDLSPRKGAGSVPTLPPDLRDAVSSNPPAALDSKRPDGLVTEVANPLVTAMEAELTTNSLQSTLETAGGIGAEHLLGEQGEHWFGSALGAANIVMKTVKEGVPSGVAETINFCIGKIPGPGVQIAQVGRTVVTSAAQSAWLSFDVSVQQFFGKEYTREDAERKWAEMKSESTRSQQAFMAWLGF